MIELFPESKFLLTLRDGRDIVYSIAFPSVDSKPTRTFPEVDRIAASKGICRFEAAIQWWLRYVERYNRVLQEFNERTLLVRYESLVSDFETIFKNISEFVSREYQPAHLALVQGPVSTPFQSSKERWTAEQKDLLRKYPLALEHLVQFGYLRAEDDW